VSFTANGDFLLYVKIALHGLDGSLVIVLEDEKTMNGDEDN
jgi:hypothetical protein